MSIEKKYILSRNDYRELVEFVKSRYGLNMSQFAYSITKRRIENFFSQYNVTDLIMIIGFLEKEKFFSALWEYILVPTTEIFRDFEVWAKISKKVLPKIQFETNIKIWVPEVTTDDELYSLLIVLEENNLLETAKITITSEFERVDSIVRNQKISQKKFQASKQNYMMYSPEGDFEKHFNITQSNILVKKEYFNNVLFKKHSFSQGDYLNEKFDFILFRNRMLNFSPVLEKTSLDIIYDALIPKGFLAVGLKESIQNWGMKSKFSLLEKEINIYQKKK